MRDAIPVRYGLTIDHYASNAANQYGCQEADQSVPGIGDVVEILQSIAVKKRS